MQRAEVATHWAPVLQTVPRRGVSRVTTSYPPEKRDGQEIRTRGEMLYPQRTGALSLLGRLH